MARFRKIILFFIVSIIAFQAQAKNPPPGTGTSDIPANILIMLDNSGSMNATIGSSALIYGPLDVSTDSSGNVYVLEYSYNRIKVFNSSGTYVRSFGSYGYGCNQWRYARQFTIYNDQIYLADYYGRRILVIGLSGQCVTNRATVFSYPTSIAVNSQYVFVGNTGTSIERFTKNGLWQSGYQYLSGPVNYTWGMSMNSSGTRLTVASIYGQKISEFSVSGANLNFVRSAGGSYSSSNGYFRWPRDTGYDSSGNIYAVDENHRLQKFNSSLAYQAKVGSLSNTGAFYYPMGMHIDSNDNIYVADYYNYTVRKFNTSLSEIGTFGGRATTRLAAAKKVIKKIVSDNNLTSGANFGLMEWGTRHNIRVKISDTGAQQIYTNVDGVYASGGTNLAKAMNIARNYFTSGQVDNWNLTCSLNFLIVISDGSWSGHSTVLSIANQMRINYNTQTFAVGYALAGASSNYNSLATAGGTTSPLYASNETELLQKLSDAIKQAISGRLTFTTPAVMSDVTKGDFVYQSTFTYEKDMQWKGSLKKYQLNADGSFGTVQWDAADKLNAKSASARNIWTSGIGISGINNFTTGYRDSLKTLIFPSQIPTDTQTENLINFIRGVDVYDQDGDGNKTESIHKLADIYHSELVVVGPPEASALDDGSSNGQKKDSYYRSQNNYNNFKTGSSCGGPCPTRKEVVFAGANNGIVHAFDTSNGEELWGFIPPSVIGNLEKIPSSKANTSNAIYGVDGSPVVKDIYFDDTPNDGSTNPRWRTVLLGGLGSGGQGLYALDITDINNPKHLFAINHDGSEQVIQHWGNNGFKNEFSYRSGSIDAKYDYRKLGETWSTPRIIRIKVSGKDKWVAVFGGGYNGAVNPNYGSAVFVMDLEDEGRLLKIIDIEDQANVMKNYVFGTVANNTQTEFNLASYGLSSYDINCCTLKVYGAGSIRYAITGDQSGTTMNNLKLKFDEAPPGGITIKVSMVNKTDIVNSLPADLTVITADGTSKANYNGALVYATDLEGKITKINLTDQGTLYQTTTLFNAQSTSDNGRYIYTRPEATINNDSNLWLYFGTGNTQKLQEQSTSVQNRVYGIKDVNFPNFVSLSSPGDVSQCKKAPNCPGGTDLGWYVNLPNYQKLSAEPTVDRDRVYFPIYEPNSSSNKCNTGIAYLNGYDTKCGNSLLNVNMGKGVLSKVVKQGDNLYIGLGGDANNNIAGFTSKDNLITGKSKAKASSAAVQLESWKENY